jgi:Arc/MetJ-type ribon-helix-helix transcriptional regulator
LKTLKISDEAHAKLTSVVGRLMAETGKMKTYSDAIEALLSKSVVLSPELLDEVESLVEENPQLGYATKEEFIQDAVRLRLISPTEKRTATNNKPGTQRLKDLVTRAKHTERKQ